MWMTIAIVLYVLGVIYGWDAGKPYSARMFGSCEILVVIFWPIVLIGAIIAAFGYHIHCLWKSFKKGSE